MWQGNYEQMAPMVCGCNQVSPAYNMRRRCRCNRRPRCNNTFVLIVVLFILLIIVGANFKH